MTWLVNGKTFARKIKDRHHGVDEQGHDNCERCIECPFCGNVFDETNITAPAWPGLPAGVKFDPSDQEILEHLAAKLGLGEAKPHPYIDVFIPTLDVEAGVYYTHPEKLPDIKHDGNCIHYFHRPRKAYMTGTRKRRKVEDAGNKGFELRWHKTGKTRPVMVNGMQLGFKKIMVLYTGSAKQVGGLGKTNWIMHQYHIGMHEEEKDGEFVVVKIFYQTQPRHWVSSRLNAGNGDDHHVSAAEQCTTLQRDQLPEQPTACHYSKVHDMINMAEDIPMVTMDVVNAIGERKGLFQTLSEEAQQMWAESFLENFQHTINRSGQNAAATVASSEQGESSSRWRVELQLHNPSMPDVASSGQIMAHVDPSESSLKVSDAHLLNLLANADIKAALEGKNDDENTDCHSTVLENASKEDIANKFEALENIILETPPEFIIESLLHSQEALDALELFKSWSDSQKGYDSFADLFK